MKITVTTTLVTIDEGSSRSNIGAHQIEDVRKESSKIISIQTDSTSYYKIVHADVTSWNGGAVPSIDVMEGVFNILMSSTSGVGGATEVTLQAVLNAVIAADQDMEVMLVRDEGFGNLVVRQIISWETGSQVVTYELVDGTPYIPVGPLVYLDPSAVLNLLLTEALAQGITLDSMLLDTANLDVALSTVATEIKLEAVRALLATIDGDTSNIDVALSTIATEATLALIKAKTDLLAPAVRTHNTDIEIGAGSVAAGSIRGSVLNNGAAAGVWNGISIPAGVSIPWGDVGSRDTYAAIAFNATGTSFIIEYTT